MAAEAELWRTILDDAQRSSQRSVASKTLLVLGDSKSGKSTLISQLGASASAPIASTSKAATLDLGLSFSYLDVRDDAEEGAPWIVAAAYQTETLARLGVYELGSSAPPHSTLLPLALDNESLLDSLALIVLDWSRPWTFLAVLRRWLSLLEEVLHTQSTAVVEDGRERGALRRPAPQAHFAVEASVRSYSEPGTSTTALDPDESVAPLPSGTLTDNLGLPVVVVCAKARDTLFSISRAQSDAISSLERDRYLSEEQIDFVQQSLRTVCLRYGAALFFTSRLQPTTTANLRSYVLHRLFQRTMPLQQPDDRPSALPATTSFPFSAKANVVDRDQVLVPAGWDSWGKIRVLRDGFEAERLGKGWASDLRDPAEADDDVPSAMRTFESAIPDFTSDDLARTTATAPVEAQDEQEFLRRHFERLLKDQSKDPRAHLSRPSLSGTQQSSENQFSPNFTVGPGVVGPMSSSSLNLPSVESALNRDAEDPAARLARLSRRVRSRGLMHSSRTQDTATPISPNGGPMSPPLASPPAGGPTSPGQTQNEVCVVSQCSLTQQTRQLLPIAALGEELEDGHGCGVFEAPIRRKWRFSSIRAR